MEFLCDPFFSIVSLCGLSPLWILAYVCVQRCGQDARHAARRTPSYSVASGQPSELVDVEKEEMRKG